MLCRARTLILSRKEWELLSNIPTPSPYNCRGKASLNPKPSTCCNPAQVSTPRPPARHPELSPHGHRHATYYSLLGLCRENGKEHGNYYNILDMEKRMETTIAYWGYVARMEKNRGTTIVYWGYLGRKEKNMETTIVHWGYLGKIEKTMDSDTTIVDWHQRERTSACTKKPSSPPQQKTPNTQVKGA